MLVGIGGDLVLISGIVVLIFGMGRFLAHLRHGLRLAITLYASIHTSNLVSFKERLS